MELYLHCNDLLMYRYAHRFSFSLDFDHMVLILSNVTSCLSDRLLVHYTLVSYTGVLVSFQNIWWFA